MKFENALDEFKTHLKARDLETKSLTPATGFEAMFSFYRDERVEGVSFENDGDMLLYEWGNFGVNIKHFTLILTRQLIFDGGEDDDIWQLELRFKYPVSESPNALGSGNQWCENLQQLDDFETSIKGSAAFQLLGQDQPLWVELGYFCTG